MHTQLLYVHVYNANDSTSYEYTKARQTISHQPLTQFVCGLAASKINAI